MYVQFADSTEATIVAVFGSPQNAVSFPNQGAIQADDTRWAAFYAMLPATMQLLWPAPTVTVPPTLSQQAVSASTSGLTISSTGPTLTMAATLFPTDPTTQTKLNTIVNELNTSGTFFGATAGLMKDAAGVWQLVHPGTIQGRRQCDRDLCLRDGYDRRWQPARRDEPTARQHHDFGVAMIDEFLFANNATSTLAAALTATATTASLAPGTGVLPLPVMVSSLR